MKHAHLVAVMALGLGVSACANLETASRNAPMVAPPQADAPALQEAPLHLAEFTVQVPRTLRVSEANMYYPGGDIVWREDPLGDRYQQVAAIFEAGLRMAAPQIEGVRPVRAEIAVKRFHAVTEKTRYTIGGVHSITFDLTLIDMETGLPIRPTREVRADLRALGGGRAIAAEARGITQKFRITHHLAKVFEAELTSEEGYRNANLGLMQALNQI